MQTLTSEPPGTDQKKASTGHPRHATSYTDAIELQRIAMAHARSPDTPAHHVAQLMRSYDALERLKRDIRMRPKPKPIDTSTLQRKSKRKATTLATSPDGAETA